MRSIRNALFYFLLIGLFNSCIDNYQREYYSNGSLKWEAQKKRGVFDGPFRTFYEDGTLQSEGSWIGGIGNGTIKRYFKNGNLEESANWKDGKLQGPAAVYYPEGGIRLKAEYQGGCKNSNYLVYYKSGRLSERHVYDDCQLLYVSKFDDKGKKTLEIILPAIHQQVERDSLIVSFVAKIPFAGEAYLMIGEGRNHFNSLTEWVQLHDTIAFKIAPSVNQADLLYQFSYAPASNDSLQEFTIQKKIIEKDSANYIQPFDVNFVKS